MIPPLLERKPDGGLRVNAHKGQRRILESKKRFVFAISGTQSGKTEIAPIWLYEEMKNCGDGDYLVVSPTYPIQQKKVLPTFLKVYHDMMKLGEYRYSDRIYYVKAHGLDCKIFFSSADNPESLESATAKAAYLDEVGMSGFKLQSWEAVLRRLGIHQGRIFAATTIYNLGWMKHEIYDKWKAGDPNIDVIQFPSILNPAYPKAEFERAKKTMPAWKFNMFYMGEYDIPAGLIYDCFSGEDELESVHLDPNWNRYVFHDFGGVNMAALWIAEQQVKEGKPIFVIYREYLKGGMSIEGHSREFQKLSEGEKIQARIGGGPSEDQYRRDFGNHSWPIQRPPISDVEVGIDRVYGLHRENRIKVLKSCRAYLDEKGSYSRKLDENGDPTEKIQDKESYHLMDCERYGMSYLTQREQSGGGFTVELGDERDMLA